MRRAILLSLIVSGCLAATSRAQRAIEFPVKGAVVPFVAGGGVVSYIDEKAKAFRLITWRDGKWSAPRTIAEDPQMLINRADFPSVSVSGKTIVATWSTRKDHGSVVHVAKSTDGGKTWTRPSTPHPSVVSQFGFVSLAGSAGVYLDGRKLKGGLEGDGEMELRTLDGAALDGRVCDCCQTAIARTSQGLIAAYRDRSADETRDISVVRKTAKGWTTPKTLHADGWKIPGCPVNGPQLDANGNRVVVAWFTAANNDPHVSVAFSNDAGATFGAPIRVSTGPSAGRTDVVLLADGSAVVTWVAQQGDKARLHARRVRMSGTLGAPVDLGDSAGFPRAARWNENVAVVWSTPAGVQVRLIERP